MKNLFLLMVLSCTLFMYSCDKDEFPDDALKNTSWEYHSVNFGYTKTFSFSDNHTLNGDYLNGASHVTWKGKYYPVEGKENRFVIELNDPYQYPVHNMELDTSYTVFHVNVGYDNLSVIDHRGAFIETYSKK